ncbi:MAG: 3-oxoacyl-ACP synthase III [Pirellulaceae bacterium]|jgi:3-oxoacyl-[acyl-carrier-protein] synthase-3|nr:3-oxoacyl-ACP synthase III [Pirellulaceae bacterium]
MHYQNVCLEALGYSLPDEVVTSDQIESQLGPLYRRLRLPEGRLELMSGIRERRLWPRGTKPSDQSIVSARRAIENAGVDPKLIGCLIHGSVCRDQLEPATACRVHHALELRPNCQVYDVSNACLGLLSGILQVANLIELGQIQAGVVVGTEDSRSLLESTIGQLNADESLTRETVKPAFASLTIGSASAAVLLVHRDISQTGNRLAVGSVRAHTSHHELCQGGHEGSSAGTILMQTDSEQLLAEGLAAGAATFDDFLKASQWSRDELHRTVCHQVGGTHRKLMLQSLCLPPGRDYVTYPWLGNTGSVALPITLALAVEDGFVQPHEQIALLGIGSGINSIMLGVEWEKSLLGRCRQQQLARPHFLPAGTNPVGSLS